MPAHWLYRFFPEARAVDLGRTLDPQALFVTLFERGFQVKLQRRTYDQAVSLGAIRQMVAERKSHLAGPQMAYQVFPLRI